MLLTALSPAQLLSYYQQCHALYVSCYAMYTDMLAARERGDAVDMAALRALHERLQGQAQALTFMRELSNMPKG
jgi:hypothetical protein